MSIEEAWLLALADPEKPDRPLPTRRLEAKGVASLCLLANMHGVLPAVLQRVGRLLCDEPAKLLANAGAVSEAQPIIGTVRERLAERSAMAMFLGAESQRLIGELAAGGAEAIELKGADFAARLYAPPALRTFGDIDLFVRTDDWNAVGAVMSRLGYRPHEQQPMKHAGGYSELAWEHPAMPGAVVEVHSNLVNSPSVRRGVSVRWEDLPLENGLRGRRRATRSGGRTCLPSKQGRTHPMRQHPRPPRA